MVGIERFVTPEHILAPQVRMRTTCVHGNVRLKVHLNVELILLEGHRDVIWVGVRCINPIKVLSDLVLLAVEAIVIDLTDGKYMLGQQLSNHTPTSM